MPREFEDDKYAKHDEDGLIRCYPIEKKEPELTCRECETCARYMVRRGTHWVPLCVKHKKEEDREQAKAARDRRRKRVRSMQCVLHESRGP